MSPSVARCYMRVSTEEQAASGYSLAGQREKLELFAQLQGYAIGGWYRDDGVSAKDLNRPEFQRLMAEAGRGDVILVYKLDRLTRSVRDLDDLLRTFEARELHFRSVTEQFDTTTATGRLMIRMVAEFAQWERETIAERTAFGKQKKSAAGEWGGGRPPFGYALAPSDRVKGGRTLMKLVPDPARSHLVGAIFERYLAGHGVRAIATWLNTELGARSALGRPWDGVKVARLLQNPAYLGVIAAGRTGGGGQRRLVPSTHPPLVAAPIFHQVQAMFRARKQMAPRQATGIYPLSGIAVCGVCGGPVRVQHAGRSSRYYYGCRSHALGNGCGARPLTSAPGPTMEARVAEAITHAVASPVHLDRFWMQLAHQEAPAVDDTSRILADLAEAERALGRWDRLYETGILTEEEYVARAAPHRERSRLLQERLRQARQTPAPAPQRQEPPHFPAVWAAAEPAERKMLLQHFTAAWGTVIRLLPGQGLAISHARTDTQAKSGKP